MKEREHLSPKQLLEALQCCAAPVSEDSCERCPNWTGEAFPECCRRDLWEETVYVLARYQAWSHAKQARKKGKETGDEQTGADGAAK